LVTFSQKRDLKDKIIKKESEIHLLLKKDKEKNLDLKIKRIKLSEKEK
jgi:hypothetical protein